VLGASACCRKRAGMSEKKKFLRFRDLKARGIVGNWQTLQRWIQFRGFPPGRLLGANSRVWTEQEVEDWIAQAPISRKAGGE
jgi:predicted DNA-binding transcriptional regulator AlpA